jgi:hypothetical protein
MADSCIRSVDVHVDGGSFSRIWDHGVVTARVDVGVDAPEEPATARH